jgi:hypothetical protein
MTAVTFDTLKFVRTLEAAGLASKQAEAISFAVRDAQEAVEVATKTDLRELELRIDARLERIQGDLRALESRMTVKFGSMLVAAVGVLALLMKL